jgi:carbamoylphosphate synthase small subunit
MFKIYHIKGIKIGCTKQLTRRMREQGFEEYEILEEHDDIDVASKREIELQKQYGYIDKFCKIEYKTSVLNASKNKGGFKNGHIPWNTGKPHSNKTKQKISLVNKGRKQSDEEKEKRRLSAIGNKSDEYKKQQSERIKLWWDKRKQNKLLINVVNEHTGVSV